MHNQKGSSFVSSDLGKGLNGAPAAPVPACSREQQRDFDSPEPDTHLANGEAYRKSEDPNFLRRNKQIR